MSDELPYNDLAVEVYDSGVTPLNDPDEDADSITGIAFEKQYQAGLYGDGSFFVSRDPLREWLVSGAKRVVLRNGLEAVYEGWLSGLDYSLAETEGGVLVALAGGVDHYMLNWPSNRRFADNRVSEDVWTWDTAAPAKDKCDADRTNRLKFVPKNVQWASTDWAQYVYSVVTGQTVRRIKGSYQLQEGAQQWKIEILRSTDGSAWTAEYTIANASGTGTFDRTLGTATRYIAVRFTNDSGGNQTPASDGSILGEIYNIIVYETIETLTADITMETVARFIVKHLSQSWGFLNADETLIGAAGTPLTVEPYLWDAWRPYAGELNEIVSFGDGAQNRWAWGLKCSEEAAASDGRPVLFLEQYPSTSSYEYNVTTRDENLLRPYRMSRDYRNVYNWIPVRYIDASGFAQIVTPNDDASLKDQTSIDLYGLRAPDGGLDVGQLGLAAATSFGKAFLADFNYPKPALTGPIDLMDYIYTAGGSPTPVSRVNPGERIRLPDWSDDETGEEIIFVISRTVMDGDTGSCAFHAASPLAPILPRMPVLREIASALPDIVNQVAGGGGSGGSGGKTKSNWKRKWAKELKALGIDAWAGPKLGEPGFKQFKDDAIAKCKALKKKKG